jgi:hypothetical protein
MKKIIELIVVVAILFSVFPVCLKAQESLDIFLKQGNIVLTNSYIKFVGRAANDFYALVIQSGRPYVFRSGNQGKTWQKTLVDPPSENFVAMAIAAPNTIGLATANQVFLSRDGGKSFGRLGGPEGLDDRSEKITSLAVFEDRIAVGIWNPASKKIAKDGAYFYRDNSWPRQRLSADVSALAFASDGIVIAVASSDSGTHLAVYSEDEWTDRPINISAESEIESARIAVDSKNKVFVALNTKKESNIYQGKLESGKMRNLDFPREDLEIQNLDSVAVNENLLAIGATVKEDGAEKAAIFFRDEESQWEIGLTEAGTSNCQAVIGQTIFTGIGGKAGAFCRLENDLLTAISLINISSGSGIKSFWLDNKVSFVITDNNILRVVTDDLGVIVNCRRVFYKSSAFVSGTEIQSSHTQIFILEPGEVEFWISDDQGFSWSDEKAKIEMISPRVVNEHLWYAGDDNMVYRFSDKRLSSGLVGVKAIWPGSKGIILVSSSKEISLVPENGQDPVLFPKLPASANWQVSYENNFIMATAGKDTYRILAKGGQEWERVESVPTATPSPIQKLMSKPTSTPTPILEPTKKTPEADSQPVIKKPTPTTKSPVKTYSAPTVTATVMPVATPKGPSAWDKFVEGLKNYAKIIVIIIIILAITTFIVFAVIRHRNRKTI